MSGPLSLEQGSATDEDYRMAIDAYLAEMRLLESRIAAEYGRIEDTKKRTDRIWSDIERLRGETRAILADLRART